MNTGEKNTLGRTIFKGSRGGTYVLSGTKKVYKYTKAPVPTASAPRVGPPKNKEGRILYRNATGDVYVLNGTRRVYSFSAKVNNRMRAKASYTPSPAPAAPRTPIGFTKTRFSFSERGAEKRPVYTKKIGTRTEYWVLEPKRKLPIRTTEVYNNKGIVRLNYAIAVNKATKAGIAKAARTEYPGHTKTNYISDTYEGPVYRKNATGIYFARGPSGTLYRISRFDVVRNSSGVTKPLGEYLKAAAAPAAAPAASVAPTGSPGFLGYTKTEYKTSTTNKTVYQKNISGRYYILQNGKLKSYSMSYNVKNSHGVVKKLSEHLKGKVPPKPKPKPKPVTVPSSGEGRMPTPSPRAVISTAERNRRLAEIRARLNAIKAKRLADMPKARKNIEQKLRVAYWRARARVSKTRDNLAGKPMKTMKIRMCHAPMSVPRKKCTDRVVDVTGVYTGDQPLVKSGGVVAMHEDDFDLDWFKRQNVYISKLNDYDFWTVQAHTNRSHSWIGPYTYKGTIPGFDALGESKHIRPLWPQVRKMILNGTYSDHEQWVKDFKNETNENERYHMYSRHITRIPTDIKKQALEMYKRDLKRIIAGAPKAKKKMILYRGSHFDIFKGTKGHWYKLKSFCSAAYNVKHALVYGNTFTRITVLPGTPVLFVAGTNQWDEAGEYEVMVNIDTQYLIRSRDVKRHVYYGGSRQSTYTPFKVTDVTIMK